MKKLLVGVALAFAVSACAITGSTLGSSPEGQIINGANAVTAAAGVATVLLKNNKITVVQAKSYSAILHSASGHLDTAAATLKTCRAATASMAATSPDPCAPGIAADIGLAVSVVGEVQKALKSKQ